MLRKLGVLGLALGSASGTAMLLYAVMGLPIALALMAVLLSHEGAHALTARNFGAKAWPPLLIPFGIGAFGLTRIEGLDPQFRSAVALAGPLTGFFVAAALLVASCVLLSECLILPLSLIMATEVYSATMGSDGRKFKLAHV